MTFYFDSQPDAATVERVERSALRYGEFFRSLRKAVGEHYPHFDDILDAWKHNLASSADELMPCLQAEMEGRCHALSNNAL
jgi:hypothetical protein